MQGWEAELTRVATPSGHSPHPIHGAKSIDSLKSHEANAQWLPRGIIPSGSGSADSVIVRPEGTVSRA